MKPLQATAVLAVSALAAAGLGCASDTSPSAIRGDVTPYLDNLSQNEELAKNNHARVIDHNTRSAWSDLEALLLLDRPSRLSPIYVP